jgi:ATP-dependent Clp protease protease subunit
MTIRSVPPVFALAGDKDAARVAWRARFENRSPMAARKPAEVAIRAAAGDAAEILLYDEIGFWGVTADEFVRALATISAASVTVRINSPGGDVFDGLAIYNALRAHPATITCQVDGLAASAASIVALAGAKTVAADNAILMCHRAWSLGIGNSGDMLELAAVLDKIDGQLAGIYAKKSGRPLADCVAMMAGEGKADGTWFTADEAKAFGLVDEVTGGEDDESAAAENASRARINAMRRRLALAERDD